MKTADQIKKEAEEIMISERARIRKFYWDLIEIHVEDEAAPVQLINHGYVEIPEEEAKKFLEGIRTEYSAKGLSEESTDKIIESAMKSLKNELEGAGWNLIDKGIAPLDYKKSNPNQQIILSRFN